MAVSPPRVVLQAILLSRKYRRGKCVLSRFNSLRSQCCVTQLSSRTVHNSSVGNVYDVAIVGGGAMGSSSAYFLASRMPSGRICVIERDPSYSKASTTLSVASIRQQFSIAENIQMSQFGFWFLSRIQEHLTVDSQDPPDIQLHKGSYLFLSSKDGEETLRENHRLQRELGCDVVLLSSNGLREKFPWLNTEGITLGSLGTANEGWFDPWAMLQAFKQKAISLGVDYICGETVDIGVDHRGQVCDIKVTTRESPSNPRTIHCGTMVNAAGPNAGRLAKKLGIYLPVEPRKRSVFVLDCPSFSDGRNLPLVVDITGAYIRPETSGYYLVGMAPDKESDTEASDFEVDHYLFDHRIWPIIANRIPAFECLKVRQYLGYEKAFVLLNLQSCIID